MVITNSRYALVGYFITSYRTRAHGINRGYYIAARRYEICLVLNTIREVSYLQATIFYYIKFLQYITTSLAIFRRFPTHSRKMGFSKTCPKTRRTFPNISRAFPKISEDCKGLPKTIRRGFDHTPTNLREQNCHQKLYPRMRNIVLSSAFSTVVLIEETVNESTNIANRT